MSNPEDPPRPAGEAEPGLAPAAEPAPVEKPAEAPVPVEKPVEAAPAPGPAGAPPADGERDEDEPVDPGLAALEDDAVALPPPPPPPAPPSEGEAPEWKVGVRLADGEVMDFNPRDLSLRQGDMVVVDNERDLNLGRVVYRAPNEPRKPLRRVVRLVSEQDLLLLRNRKREEEAFQLCGKCIAERNLPMKLVQVAYLHGGNKAVFFFTADGRVDFRALVRDLAQQLHVRIEMRQIGVRDEARLLTGCGICGQALCCARYLRRFVPVSIKMAKNQGLALNPQKVSGVCGRLMCCLVYEDAVYKELRQGFPKVGKTIETPHGPGRVLEADVLGGKVRVGLAEGIETFTIEEIRTGVAAARKAEPPPGRARPTGQSVVTRVRERLQEARGAAPGLDADGELPAADAPADERPEAEEGAEAGPEQGEAAAKPAEGDRPAGQGQAGEHRGRRRRRRRHSRSAQGGGQPAPDRAPQGAPRPPERPSPPAGGAQGPAAQDNAQPGGAAQAPAGEGGARRGRRRRRRRHSSGGGAAPSNPSPSPGPGPAPAAG